MFPIASVTVLSTSLLSMTPFKLISSLSFIMLSYLYELAFPSGVVTCVTLPWLSYSYDVTFPSPSTDFVTFPFTSYSFFVTIESFPTSYCVPVISGFVIVEV